MDKKTEELEQKFLQFQDNFSEESAKNRDLDEAMGDTISAGKRQIAIEMLNRSAETFEQVKNEGNLEDVTASFINWLDEEKGKLELRITQAREQENKQEMIENQIRIGVLKGPIEGMFKHYLKQIQKS